MRIAAAVLLYLFLAPVASAQDIVPLAEGQYLQGRFRQQRFMQGFAAPLESQGRFTLAPGQGLLWRAETPFAAMTIIGPSGLVQEVNGTETMRLPANRAAFLARTFDILAGALGGNWRALDDIFEVTRSQRDAGWELTLVPRRAADAELPFRRIVIRGARFAEAVEIEKVNGDRDVLTFGGQQLMQAPLPADEQVKFNAAGHR